MSLKDKIQRNEIDLSLNQLVEVPVKELAAASKATHLDLSCNSIKYLPEDFATLTHLIKIDLRQNSLVELPSNFGNLINLQTLDLYDNKIRSIPLSFCKLKNLRWLDLKNNPLEPELKETAGDCLDEKQCQLCAKRIVAFMQSIDSELERQKQKKLKEIRDKEAIEKDKAEKELEQQRKIKKLEKEKRKAELKAQREEKHKQQLEKQSDKGLSHGENIENSSQKPRRSAWLVMCFKLFLMICLSTVLYFLYQDENFQKNLLPKIKATAIESMTIFKKQASEIMLPLLPLLTDLKSAFLELLPKLQENVLQFWVLMIPYFNAFKNNFLGIVHSAMLYVSELATNLELMFGTIYFS